MPALSGGGIHQARVRCFGLRDPAAAEQARAVIDDGGLARRYAIFRAIEAHPFAVPDPGNRRGEGAYFDAHVLLVFTQPVPVGDAHSLDCQRPPRPDHDPPALGLDSNDVERLLLAADLDPPSLAHREMDDSAMTAERSAIEIDDVAGRFGLRPQPLHETGIIAVRNEADVLAVWLGRDLETEPGRDLADFVLGQVAER